MSSTLGCVKLRSELENKIDNFSPKSEDNLNIKPKEKKNIPAPTKVEMNALYDELSKCKTKPVVLSVVEHYFDSYILPSRHIPTIPNLFDAKYLDLSYPELIDVCMNIKLSVSKENIAQVEKDTIKQAKGTNFFKHRAGRIGASQSKAACHTNPALPAKTLVQAICYPELSHFSSEATDHCCKHEALAICTYEQLMQSTHTNFKVKQCGLFINQEMLWIHATPDFLYECDCCGLGYGEVKCLLCLDNCDFESYVLKKNSCLKKSSQGNYYLPNDHQYYYQVQQQLFTTRRQCCDFVVCAVSSDQVMLTKQQILPDQIHWKSVVPKLEKFWRVCILPEVLGRWSTWRCRVTPSDNNTQSNICYCRSDKDEDTVKCCNQQCPIGEFHLSCLGVDSTPKTWYCPNCRSLPNFKPAQKKKDMLNRAMKITSICICKGKPNSNQKILECTSHTCTNGTFFHLNCLNFKRMPNNSSSWVCSVCKVEQQAKSQQGISTNTSQHPGATNQFTTHQPHTGNQPTTHQPHAAQANADVVYVKTVVVTVAYLLLLLLLVWYMAKTQCLSILTYLE